jgi:hypothetical protein
MDMSQKDKMEELKKKQERLVELIKEYQLSKAVEEGRIVYELIEDEVINREENWIGGYIKCPTCHQDARGEIYPIRDYRYILIDIKAKIVVAFGKPSIIKSYLRLRGIDPDKVLNKTKINLKKNKNNLEN